MKGAWKRPEEGRFFFTGSVFKPDKNGAGDRIRTGDVHLGRVAFYH
jgi:hypothetical protein